MDNAVVIKTLFLFIGCFILVNLALNLGLAYKFKERIFRQAAIYWAGAFVLAIAESVVTQGVLAISLIIIFSIFPIFTIGNILLESYGESLSKTRYIIYGCAAIVVSLMLFVVTKSFFWTSLPISIYISSPLIIGTYYSAWKKRSETDFVQGILGNFVFILSTISCFYYSTDRMRPGALLFGFGSAFFCYLFASISLPIFTIQRLNKEKTESLEALVEARTIELKQAHKQKEKLLWVLLHDLANPLMAIKSNLRSINFTSKVDVEQYIKNIEHIEDSSDAMEAIISHVRESEIIRSRNIESLRIDECFKAMERLFDERFEQKNIKLIFQNSVPKNILINVDKTAFLYSVTSNLLSNALKFSFKGSEVIMRAKLVQNEVELEVVDRGTGMNIEIFENIFTSGHSSSSIGTSGETGSGYGVALAKLYTEEFAGNMKAVSKENHGTTFTISLPASTEI